MRTYSEGWLERDGVRLRYLDWAGGDAADTPLFMLHGLSSSALYWQRLAEHLPERRIVALDQRSHGASDRPATGYSSEVLVADATATMEQLGLLPALVVGHSWGTSVALALAATRPDLAAGLAFIDGPAGPMSERLSWEEAAALMQPPLPRFARRSDAATDVRNWIRDSWDEDLQAYAESRTVQEGEAWVLTLTGSVREEILRELYAFQPQLFWAQLEVPLLLALATSEPPLVAWKRQSAELVSSLVPDAVVRWYQSGHDIPLLRPAELAADIERTCLRAGWRRVAVELSGMAGDWSRKVSQEWTARDLLAHIVSSQASMAAVLRAPAPAPAQALGPVFDADRWNASQVRRRQALDSAELIQELRVATAELEPVLIELDLQPAVGVGAFAGRPAGEVARRMLRHQLGHEQELRKVLAQERP